MDVTLSLTQLKDIAGPRIIGFLLNSMLYGSLVVQVYFYYQAFPKDAPFIKHIVYGIFLLETAQTIMTFRDCYVVFTNSLMDPIQVNSTELGWLDVAIIDGITSCIVQNFFAYRIYLLSKRKVVPCIISIISFTQAIGAVMSGIIARTAPLKVAGRISTQPTCVWLIGGAVCDIFIASFMTYYLCRCDSRFRETRALVNKLIRMTIETGLLTASVAVVLVIIFMLDKPKDLAAPIIFVLMIILSKLYSNTTLAILNSRRSLGQTDEISGSGQSLSLIDFGQPPERSLGILDVLEDDHAMKLSGNITSS